ncbi:MAG: alpha/beta hydrolase [Chloroflexota bacterium]
MKKLLIVILIIMINLVPGRSQNTIIRVWSGDVPGSIKNDTYTEVEQLLNGSPSRYNKVTDPTLTVFLPAADKATGSAVLICPGGGYGTLAFDHEGYQIAQWLNENGIAGIILKYRLPSDLIMKDKTIGPLQDAQEGMRSIRRHAAEWKINPRKVGVIGFSAGGHLASTLSTHYAEKVYPSDTTSARPDFSLLIYPVITFDSTFTHMGSRTNLIGRKPSPELIKHFSNEQQVDAKTPRAFLVHSMDDNAVPVRNSIEYYNSLVRYKIPSELHVFEKGGHGYGMSVGKGTQAAWPGLCISWLKANKF